MSNRTLSARTWVRLLALIAISVAPLARVLAQSPVVTSADVGAPGSNARVELFQPEGTGPFPAMIVLPGCDGVDPHYREWARQIAEWGYLTALVDSFRPRGFTQVCKRADQVAGAMQVSDAFAVGAYLRTLPIVRGDRVGAIGFLQGGGAVLKAALADQAAQSGAPPFAAAVAFYPSCERSEATLATDTLILIGDAEGSAPVTRCMIWRKAARPDGHTLRLEVFKGALHGFDALRAPHNSGHRNGDGDPTRPRALELARQFLADRLLAAR